MRKMPVSDESLGFIYQAMRNDSTFLPVTTRVADNMKLIGNPKNDVMDALSEARALRHAFPELKNKARLVTKSLVAFKKDALPLKVKS